MQITINVDDDDTSHIVMTWPAGTTAHKALHGVHVAFMALGEELHEGRTIHMQGYATNAERREITRKRRSPT